MESARRAEAADLTEVVALAREGQAELRLNRGGAIWSVREARREPIDDDLMGALAGEPGRFIVVGLIDATIVGFGAMHLETLHDHDVLAVVTDLYVVKEARGVGVGEAMMDLLLDHAGDAGAVGIDALALPGDRATKNFFERFGLTARAILVHRSLRSPEAASGGEYR
ncbi:MAG: GNAT family N-acetyltransferase [Acidimicrobiales bacterium]|nr:GNAT family N-acetyltransferase [Acidimicrobiales bacterium]